MPTLSPAMLDPMTACGAAVTADGRTLPLRATRLRVRAAAGLAQVQLVQTFSNPFAEPLHITYRLPLPADAAVAGFQFRLGDQHVQGEIDRRAAARERFEQAIASGRTAALLEQDRSALFTQELGNLPPGAELEATVDLDQPLAWHDGSWQWRFPTTAAPRYLGADGRVGDAERQALAVVDPTSASALPPRCELDLVISDALTGELLPHSPSHALHTSVVAGGWHCAFAAVGGRAEMDRDVVVQWPVAAAAPGVTLRTMRPAAGALAGQAFGLLTIVPPLASSHARPWPRDLIVLLDISGSMAGAPLAQAQQITSELIRSLGDADRLELIAFASQPQAWSSEPQPATVANRTAAEQWVRGLRASGGTEMHAAILQAMVGLRGGAQRQVVLVTDGLIGFEREVVGAIRSNLPAGSRVHVVGVGSAPNRTLTRGASRAGRGIELLVGLDEPVGPVAQRLLARTAAPLVQSLEVTGSAVLACAPQALPDLFAGAPVRIHLQLRPEGGSLHLRGALPQGGFEHAMEVAPSVVGGEPAIARGHAREVVEDLEVELAATGAAAAIDPLIEQLGLDHRIATRLTSWVAILAGPGVDPRAVHRREVVPHELPYGTSMQHLGLRASHSASRMVRSVDAGAPTEMCMSAPMASMPLGASDAPAEDAAGVRDSALDGATQSAEATPPVPPKQKRGSFLRRLFGGGGGSQVQATLRLRNLTEWVYELTGLVAWQLPARVVLVWADGSEVELAVDPTRTTVAGPVAAGGIVRLVLRAPAGAMTKERPVRLRLPQGPAMFDVTVA